MVAQKESDRLGDLCGGNGACVLACACCKELEDLKESSQAELAALERKLLDENDVYRRRAVEAEKLSREIESTGATEAQRCQAVIDQLKEKTAANVSQISTSLRVEMESSKRLAGRVR